MKNQFEEEVARRIEELRPRRFHGLERAVAARHRDWIAGQNRTSRVTTRVTPRDAFELLHFDFLQHDPEDFAVMSESDDEIVWRSSSPCATLEACAALRLDTRDVCRAVYEKSTQAFLSALDPRLRFVRSVDAIRPHAGTCLERILRIDLEALMEQAIDEALVSHSRREVGHGAVLWMRGGVVAAAHGPMTGESDATQHAELEVLRRAARRLGDANLCGAVLVSTSEPCAMCTAAAVWANITTIVFGATLEKIAQLGIDHIMIPAAEVVSRGPTMIEVIGGVLEEPCLDLYRPPPTLEPPHGADGSPLATSAAFS